MLLLLISFIAGILTVLAPCVLPLLPVIVGGSLTTGSRRRTYVICISLGVSVIAFTLLLKASTALINVPQSFWWWFSGGILILFGLVMLFPRLWDSLGFVNLLNRSSQRALAAGYKKNSFWGDVVMGAALGPVFASCSPTYFVILATVLPASFFMGLLDLLAYAVGLSGFLLVIALAGQRLVDRLGVTVEPGGWFRKSIGVLFIIVGLGVATGVSARVEVWLLERGFSATKYEQLLLGAPTISPVTNAATSSALTTEAKALLFPRAPELVQPDGYINTPRLPSGQAGPITLAELRGKKVVLLDIWTYSCINCQRTLPYLKDWYAKYKDEGLEIIAVHTPEFAFEKVQKNVERAVAGFGLAYPVVLDNEYRTWNALGNQYWPRKYLVDIDGYIVYDHIGEGAYAETELQIQRALLERAERLGVEMSDVSPPAPSESAGGRASSPETYFGAWRNNNFGNGAAREEGRQALTIPAGLTPNVFYLGGTWNFEYEYATNESRSSQLRFVYDAKDVYFVAAAPPGGGPVKMKVTRDGGKPLGAARGEDVDVGGFATIQEERLYKLIQDTEYGPHTIEIEVEGTGLRAYTFTFG